MSWTYNPSLNTSRDRVRLYIGDTDTDDQQLSNEEIDAMLLLDASVFAAAAMAARTLAAKYARQADKWVGDLKILASQKARAYHELAETLTAKSTSFVGTPTAGGVLVAEKETAAANTALVQPYLSRGRDDYQGD